MNRAFLSYSTKDKDIVHQVYRYLGRRRAIVDEYSFEDGLQLITQIEQRLSDSDVVVLFISDTALDSDWVKKEFELSRDKFYLDNPGNVIPILIDRSINIKEDNRIPEWLKSYLIRVNRKPHLIGKKVDQILRNISLQSNTVFAKRERIFVGRNFLFDQFEENYLSFDNPELSTVVVSGYPSNGRRTFLRNAMRRTDLIARIYDPIYVTYDSKDSLESFILKIKESIESYNDDFLKFLSEISFDEKVDVLLGLIIELNDNNEKIFIVDDGGIIKANNSMPNWFLSLISKAELEGTFSLSVISRFRVPNTVIKSNKNLFEIKLPALKLADVKKLFVGYCKSLNVRLNPRQYSQILELINTGSPSQVHFAVEYIKQFGIADALSHRQEIETFGSDHINSLVKMVENQSRFNLKLLVLLCQFEFVSYDLLYKIVGEDKRDMTEKSLQQLFVLGVFDLIGANKEYIKVTPAVYNYIVRSQSRVAPEFKKKIKIAISDFVTTLEDDVERSDFSELLFTVKGALINGNTLPRRYYIPSFILKTVRDLYYFDNYKDVIRLIDETLENPNRIDPDLIWDFKYWMCQALAKTGDRDRFEKEVSFFSDKGKRRNKSADFFFLHGFFARCNRDPDQAETHYKQAIKINNGFNRAKKELVNVYLLKQEYDKALDYAKANYLAEKTNAFHLQSYFTCLIKKPFLSTSEISEIRILLERIQENHNSKAEYLFDVMNEEFEFYIKRNKTEALQRLTAYATSRNHRRYAMYALREALKRDGRMGEYNKIEKQIKKINLF